MCGCENGLPREAGQVRRTMSLVLSARRQYGYLSHKVVSSNEQFLSMPHACHQTPSNRQTGRRKQERSGVCLYYKKPECPALRKKLLQFFRKNLTSIVMVLKIDGSVSRIIKEASV